MLEPIVNHHWLIVVLGYVVEFVGHYHFFWFLIFISLLSGFYYLNQCFLDDASNWEDMLRYLMHCTIMFVFVNRHWWEDRSSF